MITQPPNADPSGAAAKTHNPDVLTCLANLSADEVFTPPKRASAMLDALPQGLFEGSGDHLP